MPQGPGLHSLSQSGADIFAAAGRYPGQITETPVALFNRLSEQATGWSPVDAVGNTPVLGQVLGFAGEALERVGNFVPSLINSGDLAVLQEFGNKPDDFELPAWTGQRADGLPVLGALPGVGLLFSRAKTVGELKRELEKRGFLVDPETGQQRTWAEVLGGLRSGRASTFDFGYAAINDNPLADLAGRLAIDPTNLLFFVPGANVGKAAQAGAKIANAAGDAATARAIISAPRTATASNLVRTGLRAAEAPAPIVAKQAIAAGDAANATMRGWSSMYRDLLAYPTSTVLRTARAVGQRAVDPRGYLGLLEGPLTATSSLGRTGQIVARAGQGYAKSSAALSASLAVTGNISGRIAEVAGGNTFFQGFHDFVEDVENDNPLSENAAWMVASAFSFPYGDLARSGRARISPETLRAFGQDFEPVIARALNFKNTRQLHEALGGPEAVQQLIVYLLKHRAKQDLDSQPLVGARIGSAPEAAVRASWSDEALASRVTTLLRENKVSGDDLVLMLRDWHESQGGYRQIDGQQLTRDLRANEWRPDLVVQDWRRFAAAQSGPGAIAQVLADGAMGLGLRNYVFFEAFTDSIIPRLKQGRDADVVPREMIREVLSDHPALAISDPTGYWKNAALPDAAPVTWGSVRRKLANQAKEAPKLSDELGPMRLLEETASREDAPTGFESPDDHVTRLNDELEQRTAGGVTPDNARSRDLQGEIDAEIARRTETEHASRADAESQAFGPEASRILGRMDAGVPELKLDPTTHFFDAEQRAIAQEVERAILEIDPTYTVKALPKSEVLVQMRNTDPALYQLVKDRTLLGELLFDRGPVAPFTGFMKSLLRPVKGDRQARAARQALYQRMIPHGAKPATVDAWIDAMARETEMHTVAPRGVTYHMYRDVASLPAATINRLAREVFGETSSVVRQFDGKFHDVLDMAAAPMWRSVRNQIRQGGRKGELARAVEAWGKFYREGPVISSASDVGRLVGKTYYHWFRFLLDPRWHMLNLMERNFLGGAEDGIVKGNSRLSEATGFHLSGARKPRQPFDNTKLAKAEAKLREGRITETEFNQIQNHLVNDPLVDELTSGWYYGRGLSSWIGKSFDERRMGSTIDTLNGFGQTDAAGLLTLRRRMRGEAEADLAQARTALDEGRITSEDFARFEQRANLDIENSTKDLAQLLDEKLYEFDQKGVRASLQDEAARMLEADEMRAIEPLLDVLYEKNEQLWRDVNRLYHGNPERSSLERIANSYWFYWPISYQIKAVSWLARVMLSGSFGHNNNALLAGKYAAWHEQHQERIANSPTYASMFKENKDLWFTAQMILPMTPDGIGASLSRPVRLAGDWLGLFQDYKQAQTPLSAINYITDLGPIYTWHLVQNIDRETRPDEENK